MFSIELRNVNMVESLRRSAVDIQEFYDTTLLDESKSVQQKTTETLQIVAKWEQTLTIAGGLPQQTTLQTEVPVYIRDINIIIVIYKARAQCQQSRVVQDGVKGIYSDEVSK